MKAIRYKSRAELFVLNGNKRPIRYEFHNGVKPNWYNGNMVFIFELWYYHCTDIVGITQNMDLFQNTSLTERSNKAVGNALKITTNFYKKYCLPFIT